jgi:predicted glycoside hydrolase/deacetylase ChbG (UPF0249 family)
MSRDTQICTHLGYQADARLLILNADDFGLCHAENEGTIQFIKEGVGSSCTLMMPCPWGLHAMRLLREYPDIPFGVHLTVVGEYADYRWRPVSSPEKVPSLVDDRGFFKSPADMNGLLRELEIRELAVEFRAQIGAVLECGLKPTHLDSHWHVHELRDDVFDLCLALGKEFGLALRAGHVTTTVDRLREEGLPTCDVVVDSGRIPDSTGRSRDSSFSNPYACLLREVPAGLTEWAIHVGIDTPELRTLMPMPNERGYHVQGTDLVGTWRGRTTDLDFFASQEAKEIIDEEGIVVLSFEPLQRLWQARS